MDPLPPFDMAIISELDSLSLLSLDPVLFHPCQTLYPHCHQTLHCPHFHHHYGTPHYHHSCGGYCRSPHAPSWIHPTKNPIVWIRSRTPWWVDFYSSCPSQIITKAEKHLLKHVLRKQKYRLLQTVTITLPFQFTHSIILILWTYHLEAILRFHYSWCSYNRGYILWTRFNNFL